MRSILLWVACALLLSACAGGQPKKRVFPPQARVQELRLDESQWQLLLRVHNFSQVPMRFARVEATLHIGGIDAGTIVLDAPIEVAANSVEVVPTTLTPAAEAATAVQQSLANGRGLEYRLDGRIQSEQPPGRYPFEFASRLDQVPGLDRVLH